MKMHVRRVGVVSVCIMLMLGASARGKSYSIPVEDTHIVKNRKSANYSGSSTIQLRSHLKKERRGLLQFDLSSISEPIKSVKLKLYSETLKNRLSAVEINGAVNISSVSWKAAPAFGAVIDEKSVQAGSAIELDLSSFITASGVWTVGLQTTYTRTGKLASSEAAANQPELIVEVESVGPVNRPPQFGAVSLSTATVGQSYSASLAGAATDPDGDALEYRLLSGANWLSLDPGGRLSGNPTSGDLGNNLFSVEVADGRGGFDTNSITISVIDEPVSTTPNVVFILADDLGIGGLNCFRRDGKDWLETPRIDQLCSEGMKFTQGLASSPTCRPSRMAILTGQYAPKSGSYYRNPVDPADERKVYWEVPETGQIKESQIVISECFKDAGYATAMFGKWDIGWGGEVQLHGFDTAYAYKGHFDEGDPSRNPYPTPVGRGFSCFPFVDLPDGVSSAEYFTDMANTWMEEQVNKSKPFFLYLPYYLVHGHPESLKVYEDYFENKLKREKFKDSGQDDYGRHTTPIIAAMTKLLDDCVGDLLDQIERLGITQDTVIIFVSDNGSYSVDFTGFSRGQKKDMWDGGLRVPYIFKWPGRIPAGESEERIVHVDLYPTMLSMAGIAPPAQNEHPLDGVDLMPLLSGQVGALQPRSIYHCYPQYTRYRDGAWKQSWRNVIYDGKFKLIEYLEYNQYELFDLEADEGETSNLFDRKPAVWNDLSSKLTQWLRGEGVDPQPRADYNGPKRSNTPKAYPTADYFRSFSVSAQMAAPISDGDSDRDGVSDEDELKEGTDPYDPQSVLEILDVARDALGVHVVWSTVPGRTYVVEYSDDGQSWQTLPQGDGVVAASDITRIIDTSNPLDRRQYRVYVLAE